MDSSTHKLYHVHGFDSRQHLDNYYNPGDVFKEDFLKFPIENLTKAITEGHIEGDILIDLSSGSMVHHLYSACDFFKDIIVLKVRHRCILELKRWLDTRTGAFHWGHATQLHLDIEGESDQLQNKEEKMRSAIQHVMKCDLEKEKIMDPIVLPLADCIITAYLLEIISKDQDDYVIYLRKFSRLLKPGGYLIILGVLHTTFYKIGEDKFYCFNYDEDFARKALVSEGFIIDCCNVKKRTSVSDIIDHKAIVFIVARKEK